MDDSDCNHENDFINENSQDNKLDNDVFNSNTSLPIIKEYSDAFFPTNENVTKLSPHDNDLITDNSTTA